jgi:hypothetical protein
VTPGSASQFVDSVGVNVHTGYYDTAYNSFWSFAQKVKDLGVKYVRDGACAAGCAEQQRRLKVLGSLGIKANLIMGRPGGRDSVAQLVDMLDTSGLKDMLASVEGANEFDQAGVADWATQLRVWQQEIYTRMKANPNLADVPVYGPSLVASTSYSALGNISQYLDCGNLHPYPGGGVPMQVVPSSLSMERTVADGKPVCITESGYHNATSTSDGHLPTSERAAGLYTPRMYLDHFRAGVPRTYEYELVDEFPDASNTNSERHFGLVRNDLSEKPAFTSLKSLMKLITPTTQAPSVPTRVQATGPSDLRQLFFQQDAKHQVLVLWRDVSVWDRAARKDLAPAAQPVNVAFGQALTAEVFGVGDASTTPRQTVTNPINLAIDMAGQAVVVRLTLP